MRDADYENTRDGGMGPDPSIQEQEERQRVRELVQSELRKRRLSSLNDIPKWSDAGKVLKEDKAGFVLEILKNIFNLTGIFGLKDWLGFQSFLRLGGLWLKKASVFGFRLGSVE